MGCTKLTGVKMGSLAALALLGTFLAFMETQMSDFSVLLVKLQVFLCL